MTSDRNIIRSPTASGMTSQITLAVARWAQSLDGHLAVEQGALGEVEVDPGLGSCHHAAFAASSPDRVGSTSVNTK